MVKKIEAIIKRSRLGFFMIRWGECTVTNPQAAEATPNRIPAIQNNSIMKTEPDLFQFLLDHIPLNYIELCIFTQIPEN